MRPLTVAAICAAILLFASPAHAHQTPFSYVDLRLQPARLDISLIVHIFDVAHDLQFDPPERLLEPAVLAERQEAIKTLLRPRLRVTLDGRTLPPPEWSDVEPLPERSSLRLTTQYAVAHTPGIVSLDAAMFVYDPAHQTFVNVYENDELTLQAILDNTKTRTDYFAGTRQGVFAVFARFVPAGITHILIGPDHLLFLAGLLLLGGSVRRLGLIVTSFTLAHSVTLSLAVLGVLRPPARLIEPAIALSIIYVGADNLLVRGGRDMRAWIAFGFGFIHGFGFANVLAEMDLPRRALGWSLFSFNLGVEVGQLSVVLFLGSLLLLIHKRRPDLARPIAVAGSIFVIAAGTFWFVQRLFFQT
jgi:hypothetical protein